MNYAAKFYSTLPNIVFWLTMYDLDNVKQRLKLLYDRNDEHRLDVGTLRMLVYVPVKDIPVTRRFFHSKANLFYFSVLLNFCLAS